MIDPSKLKELVKLMVDNDLAEIDLRDEKEKVTIRRGALQTFVQSMPAAPQHHAPAAAAPSAAPAPAPAAAPAPTVAAATIDSPMVGTFYSAANPDSPAFVKVGQNVTADTVVCLIEAMKVFNEIKAEKAGVIESVLVKNGQAVEFGQKLFTIKPA